MNIDRLQFRAWCEVPLEDDAGNKKIYGFYLYYINVHDEGEAISFNDEILSDTVCDLPISDYEKSQIISYLNLHNDMVSDTFYIYKEPKYIEQCTGIRDRSGRLIYEGDLVKCKLSRNPGVIKWDQENGAFRLLIPPKPLFNSSLEDVVEFDFKVIGNIHENKNLLEAAE